MKKIAVLSLMLSACSMTPKKTDIPVIGEREPIVLSREGVGPLVTIKPNGAWKWHRTPKEVVSNLAEALGQMGAQMFAQREQLQKCEDSKQKEKVEKKAANYPPGRDPIQNANKAPK